MDRTPATEEFDAPRSASSLQDAPTEIQRPPIPAIPASREQCAACGAPLAADQRYCVECGQRRSGARPPLPVGHGAGVTPAASASAKRPLMSINATLLAGVGTLLLAMGVGILIGRSGQGSSTKSPAVQLIAAPGASSGTLGSTGTAATSGATSSETSVPGTSTSTKGGSAGKTSSSTSSSKPTPKTSRPPAPKAVKIGSKGSGAGYQKGKFTGNFFGEGEE